MAQIDPLQSAFYFPLGASVGTKKDKTEKTTVNKTRFSSMMEQKAAEAQLVSEGLPPELAGMEFEEALVYLKDQADMASDALKNDCSVAAFTHYRKTVSHLMKYIVQSNYDIQKKRRRRYSIKSNTDKYYLIKIIDEKLDQLASEILSIHSETLGLLAKIDEINGILVDLLG
ncbi:MAG: YaaR family protein [Spirochaetaceae bacterium]|nr:YaaR family protein [Spirochaetaceae bacterium]